MGSFLLQYGEGITLQSAGLALRPAGERPARSYLGNPGHASLQPARPSLTRSDRLLRDFGATQRMRPWPASIVSSLWLQAKHLLLPRFLVRIDQCSGLRLGWPHDWLCRAITELFEIVRLRILNLCPNHARLQPFAVRAERKVARHGLEASLVHVRSELVVIEALCLSYRLRQHLASRIGERAPSKAQRINVGGRGPLSIACKKIRRAGDLLGQCRRKVFTGDEPIGNWAELKLDRRHQHADHRAAHHLRREPDLVGSTDDADVVRRVRADIDDVRIRCPYGPDDRSKISRTWWIALVVDQIEAVLLDLIARACGSTLGKFGVGCKYGYRLRLWLLHRSQVKEANRERIHALRTRRHHREVFRVVEFIVDADGGEADRELVALHDGRHRRCDEVGAVGAK